MNNEKCPCECKNPKAHIACKKGFIWNPATCSCENFEYLASIAENPVITGDEIANAADSISPNVTTNMTSTVSINFHNKKVRDKMDCHILHTVLLEIIQLFIIAITCFHYTKYRSKEKRIGALTI